MDVSGAIERIRPAIVQVRFQAVGLSDELRRSLGRPLAVHALGTGFLVNVDGYAITARHVLQLGQQIAGRIEADRKEILIGLASPNTENMRGNFSLVDFDEVDEDVHHDLALLKLRRNPFKGEVARVIGNIPLIFGAARLNPSRPEDGTAIAISGYPLSESVLVTNVGWMATSWSFVTQEVPIPGAPERLGRPQIADVYLADVEVNPGNSGGPVYSITDATVIGICVASKLAPVRNQDGQEADICNQRLFYSSGLTMVVPIHYVVEILNRNAANWSD